MMKKFDPGEKNHIPVSCRMASAIGLIGLTVTMMTGCTPEAFNIGQAAGTDGTETVSDAVIYSSYNYVPVGTYDSADTAILKTISEEDRTVTLYNTVAARTYTLNYDGTTYASDKYGTTMSMAQMTEGTIVNVNFYKATKQLVNIQVSPDAWTYEDVSRFDLGGINSTATIGDRTYALTKGVQVFSEGRQTDLMNIVDGDSITVSGIGYDIYSIRVNSGHGYVRLNNDEALIGGWVEVGGTLITQITEPGMLLTVPEGTYTVRMYNDSSSVTQEITVERNQEIILDCSGVTAPEETIGRIIFHLTPETATLTMDGAVKDTSGIINAEYGVHEIVVSAPGYDTLSRYVNVSNELSEISIILDETKTYVSDNSSGSLWSSLFGNTASGNSSSGNSASGNSASRNSTSGNSSSSNTASGNKKTVTAGGYNRVYIYYPDDVEVYVDGVYAGLTPMSFRKTPGSHTIILKKSGYETRSYTIYLYDDKEDMSISFSELEALNSGSSSATTDSAGSSSGSSGSNTTDTSQSSTSSGSTTGNTGTGTDTGNSTDSGSNTDTGSDDSTGSNTASGGSTAGDTDSGTQTGSETGDTGTGGSSGSSQSEGGSGQSGESSNDAETGQHNSENP